jgi:signal transduction histidine kinase
MTLGRDRSGAARVGVRRELLIFYGAAALALIVVGFGAVVASRSVARAQALTDAERQTSRLADLVVGPLLHAAMNGDPDGYRELATAIDLRMRDGYLRQVTVWDHEGRIVYADDPRAIGRSLPTPPEVIEAIDRRVVSADFADSPDATELPSDALEDGFVEVYAPFSAPAEAGMAFEAYYDYARVDETADALLWQLIPLVLVPLVALMAIQIPIATSMATRVRRHDVERSELAERGLAASERERVRIAADLHDGPIQELAGMSYALGAVALSVPDRNQALMAKLQTTVQRSIESLRQLMVDLYPPDLSVSQLPQSLSTLAAPLRKKGMHVELHVGQLPAMNTDAVTTVYRVANEALANVAQHSEASAVVVNLMVDQRTTRDDDLDAGGSGTGAGGEDTVTALNGADHPRTSIRLQILDNGVGFAPERFDRRSQGHLGLQLLTSRVQQLGGTLKVSARPHGGTSVEAVIPTDGATVH